jgi:hypothetical protein
VHLAHYRDEPDVFHLCQQQAKRRDTRRTVASVRRPCVTCPGSPTSPTNVDSHGCWCDHCVRARRADSSGDRGALQGVEPAVRGQLPAPPTMAPTSG